MKTRAAARWGEMPRGVQPPRGLLRNVCVGNKGLKARQVAKRVVSGRPSSLGYRSVAVERRPTMKFSEPHWPTPGKAAFFQPKSADADPSWARCCEGIFDVEPRPPPSLWKCGNRAPLLLARFPSAVGSVEKSPSPSAASIAPGRTFPRFPRRVISTASIQQPFPPRRSLVTHRQILRRLLLGWH